MEYNCDPCHYSTNDKRNKHLKTAKHTKKTSTHSDPTTGSNFVCQYCQKISTITNAKIPYTVHYTI